MYGTIKSEISETSRSVLRHGIISTVIIINHRTKHLKKYESEKIVFSASIMKDCVDLYEAGSRYKSHNVKITLASKGHIMAIGAYVYDYDR